MPDEGTIIMNVQYNGKKHSIYLEKLMKTDKTTFLRAMILGISGSFFFAFNFILIRSMNIGGGYFLWTACLRYLFTLPLMALLLIKGRGFSKVHESIKRDPVRWLLWSTVGFGLFYAPLSAAAIYGESWFTSAVWQFTIVAGVLLTPLSGKKIPAKNLLCSAFIVAGIMLMQLSKIRMGVQADWPMLIITMGIAAFSYPLGNRKMMETVRKDGLTTTQRVYGMTLCSMPFWLVCSIISFERAGLPSASQCFQSFLIALLAGVIATILFFAATDMVREDARSLAVVEATQSGEVIFTVIMGILILRDAMPDAMGFAGLFVIITGMILNSMLAR